MSTTTGLKPSLRRAPPSQGLDWRPLALLTLAGAAGITFLAMPSNMPSYESRSLGCIFLISSIGLALPKILSRKGGLVLDPWQPESFYTFFFGLYYLLPLAILLLDVDNNHSFHFIAVGFGILLALVSFLSGCKIAKRPGSVVRATLDDNGCLALLTLSWICALLVAALFAWRLSNGNFYTHGNNYTVGTDTASSLLESFVSYLPLPVILLFALAKAAEGSYSRAADRSLKFFVAACFFVFVASSQFRFAASTLLVGWVGINLFRTSVIPWKSITKMSVVGGCALVVIFTIRASGGGTELSNSENQLADLVTGVVNGSLFDKSAITAALGSGGNTSSKSRAVSPLLFFDDVYDTLQSPSQSFGYGRSLRYELDEIVPRMLWADKPVFESTQIFIRGQLGMSLTDNSPNPLLQFYYEFGWYGVGAGFFLLGAGITWLQQKSGTVFGYIAFVFAWSALMQVESGVFLGLLVELRAAVILYISWFIIRYFLGKRIPRGQALRAVEFSMTGKTPVMRTG